MSWSLESLEERVLFTVAGTALSDAAYGVLLERAGQNQQVFYVYKDADSGLNHGYPSGKYGNIGSISVDTAAVDDPASPTGTSSDPARLDTARGTVMQVTFGAQGPGSFAGLHMEEPEGYVNSRAGTGYNLTGATSVEFEARSPTPGGIWVQFGVGDCMSEYVHLEQSATYQTISIPLALLSGQLDLTDVHLLFSIATNDAHAPEGGTVLLDNIRFDPVPTAQQTAVAFPLSTETFGVVAQPNVFGPDQMNRNVTTIYESAMVLMTLLSGGSEGYLGAARGIAEAFDYALRHDNHGLPLPTGADGSAGLHSAYESGDLALKNDQTAPAEGKAGDVRLAGFSSTVAPTYRLVLDGATGGNNAFAMLALAAAYRAFGDVKYLQDAETIGNWIASNLMAPASDGGYGGYYLGYPDQGQAKVLMPARSVENNADIYAAMTTVATLEGLLGNEVQAGVWTTRAEVAGDFVMRMFDPVTGRFNAGTYQDNGGQDVLDTTDFLDANTFTVFALAGSERYQGQIDWRRPVQYIVDTFGKQTTAGGATYSGFSLVRSPDSGADGIAWEFTGQVVAAMRYVDGLYRETRFAALADQYLAQIQQAQLSAPFGDGRGLVASTVTQGDQLPPVQQVLVTPFQQIPERVGLAATTWAIAADLRLNPLRPLEAVAMLGADGILNVTGTDQADDITLAVYDGMVSVTANGVTRAFSMAEGTGFAVLAGGGADLITIGAGLTGASVLGGAGDDTILGGSGDDTLRGGAGRDELYGRAGADLLVGGVGADTLRGGGGADRMRGGAGNDELRGAGGRDSLNGGAGSDVLYGGVGDDWLDARDGSGDTLDGGVGHDQAQMDEMFDVLLGNVEELLA